MCRPQFSPVAPGLILLCCSLCLVFVSETSADDRWVGPGGQDLNSGLSYSARWRTVTHAVRNLQPGDTLTILDGAYNLRSEGAFNGIADIRRSGNQRLDGSTNQTTTIRAASPRGVTLRGNLNVKGSYIRIEGLRVLGDNQNDFPGIAVNDSHHIDVVNNEVTEAGGGGITFTHSDCIRVISNQVHKNCYRNYDQHSGISVYQPVPYPDPENRYWRIEIKRNTCYSNFNFTSGRWGITDGNGIIVDDYYYEQRDFLTSEHLALIGGLEFYPHRTLIEGNQCNFNGAAGILTYLTDGIVIKNNTCIGNNLHIFDWNWNFRNRGQIAVHDSWGTYVLNNVLQSRYVEWARDYEYTPYVATEKRGGGNYWENNLLHSTVSWSNIWSHSNIANRASYADPQFADDANYDFRAVGGYGRGITWGGGHVYTDFNGNEVRGGQRTDLGAFQN